MGFRKLGCHEFISSSVKFLYGQGEGANFKLQTIQQKFGEKRSECVEDAQINLSVVLNRQVFSLIRLCSVDAIFIRCVIDFSIFRWTLMSSEKINKFDIFTKIIDENFHLYNINFIFVNSIKHVKYNSLNKNKKLNSSSEICWNNG